MCGKSAQAIAVMLLQGKPHLEQDKALNGPFAANGLRVCRIDKWLPPDESKAQNPAYWSLYSFYYLENSNKILKDSFS